MTNISGTPSVAKLQKTLGLWHIIIIGLAYIQPMTLFDTFGLVSKESHHHVPTSYIVALIAILFTEAQLVEVAEKALNDGSIIYNPKEANLQELRAILKKAW